ncbi:hypothetical protein DL98DRAFT_627778 [Cadophora sp. DSE1049]|nr:hypothetical protein DL98DRAFT_627778 [Cadophora sp. DSE1049]
MSHRPTKDNTQRSTPDNNYEFSKPRRDRLKAICREMDAEWWTGRVMPTYDQIAERYNKNAEVYCDPETIWNEINLNCRKYGRVEVANSRKDQQKFDRRMPLLKPAEGPNLDPGKHPTEFQSFELIAVAKVMEACKSAKLSGADAEKWQVEWISDIAETRHWPREKTGRPQYSDSMVKRMKRHMGIKEDHGVDSGKGKAPAGPSSSSGRPRTPAGPYAAGTSARSSDHRPPPGRNAAPSLKGQASKRSLKEISKHGGTRGDSSSSSSPSPGGQPEKRMRELVPQRTRQWSASERKLLLELCLTSDRGWFDGRPQCTCTRLTKKMSEALGYSLTDRDIMKEIEMGHANENFYLRRDLNFSYFEEGIEDSEDLLCRPSYPLSEFIQGNPP